MNSGEDRAVFDRFSSHYEEHLDDPLKRWFGGDSSDYYLQVKADEITGHLNRFGLPSQKLRALDVGCGVGRVAQLLSHDFAELHGVDCSEGMIHRARELRIPNAFFRVAGAAGLPFERNRFDLVYSMCVFHHVLDDSWSDVLEEMVRVAKPGGWLVNFEHNPLNPITRLVVKRCALDKDVKLVWPHRMISLYRRAGLTQIHTRFILFFPNVLPAVRSLEPHLFWFPIGGQFYVCGRKQ